ncbi:hypothetical protein [Microbacterium capsulatum]|uniref:Uncharacterized protein n=1 Tax=Microbacterium capsulatum TaxID=3041921 RepID=A0ABU0XL61_9MICO|nr:hypothetical protein [Microbacterium sp. ASV81]MDQ4215841.1 hypothetical protein [Microbacterium sp. ASV81]
MNGAEEVVSAEAVARRRRPWIASLVALAFACLVAMSQVDGLLGDVLGPKRDVHRLADVLGLAPFSTDAAWAAWWSDDKGRAPLFVGVYTVIDLVFIACGTTVLVLALRSISSLTSSNRRKWLVWIGVLLGAAVLEDVTLLLAAGRLIGPSMLWIEMLATSVKVLLAVGLLVSALLGRAIGDMLRPGLRRAWIGVYAQRLGVLVVVAMAFLTLFGSGELAAQVPDIYRGLLSAPRDLSGGQLGAAIVQFASVLVAGGVVAVLLVYFGRQRGRTRREGSPTESARLWPWVLAAIVIAVCGGVAAGFGALDSPPALWFRNGFHPPTTLWLVLALLVIAGGSLWLRRHRDLVGEPVLPAEEPVEPVFLVGDIVSSAWVAVTFLGPFAALIPVLVLYPLGEFRGTVFEGDGGFLAGAAILLLGLGIAAAAATWSMLRGPLRPTVEADSDRVSGYLRAALAIGSPSPEAARRLRIVERVSVAGALLLFLILAIVPLWIGQWIGPLAVTVGMLGVITGGIGWVVLELGRRRPPELFAFLRLRSTPVISLALVLPMILATINPLPFPHAVTFVPEAGHLNRPSVATALDHWNAQACEIEVDGTRIKPLVMVAAEGGGIRAATWTVDVLGKLFPSGSGCSPSTSVFASSGASGGSMGLAMFANATTADKAAVDISTLSRPGALGTDLSAMVSSDLVAGFTGIRLPSVDGREGLQARDRARLQEIAWEADASSALGTRFDSTYRPGTGYAMFNSTDSVSNCKVVVSQMRLPGGDGQDAPRCTGPDATLSHSVDLLSQFGSDCPLGLRWSTASFLSARFPFVSPSGRVDDELFSDPRCATGWNMQLLDGGLLDNSALGTLSDLLPTILAWTRAHNAEASAAVVVPVVLWISNGTAADVLAVSGNARPEWVAPLVTLQQVKGAQMAPAAWLSRLSGQLGAGDICPPAASSTPPGADGCAKGVASVQARVPGGIALASIATSPAVSLPLGWTLSGFTDSRLSLAAKDLAGCRQSRPGSTSSAGQDYASLGALLALYRPCG